ncbi:hypothetical protein Tco_0119321 [Tanacetum coccineum]
MPIETVIPKCVDINDEVSTMRKPFQMRLPSAKKPTTLLLCMMMGIGVDATKVVGNPYLDSGCQGQSYKILFVDVYNYSVFEYLDIAKLQLR